VGIIERALESGSSVLIENMGETIDAVLNPIITRSTVKKGRSVYVKLGDKDVEYNPKFRLVLHTKLSNPHYPPEIQAETTLINFTVTEVGLEDQLLALTVNKERPDLETTKIQLVNQNTEFTIRLKQLEDDLLLRLSSAEGDLTEDVELIESLEESKRVADDITVKVSEARETEKMIMVARNKYRTVAARGAMLFFLLNSLNKIHAFYQFSLNAFVIVFARGIDKAPFGHAKKKQPEAAAAEGAPASAGDGAPLESKASVANEQASTAPPQGQESTQLKRRKTIRCPLKI
jgi:dynein heavy chain, axonemal